MPLLGSYGGSSEYAYRGTLDDFPNDFSFTDLIDVNPGVTYTSESVTITGINNKSIVNISPGSTISINNGPFITTSEISTTFVENNDSIRIRIPTSSGNITDFSKTYSSTVKVGRKSTTWTILTRPIDETPNLFVFTNLVNQEVGVALTSNEVLLTGLDLGFTFPASITSGNGLISINGGPLVSSGSVTNGDRIYLRLNSPFEFSNNPAGSGIKSNQTFVRVGTVTTSWSISTREPDFFIEPFDFNDLNNVQPSSVFEAQSVNSLGVVSPISGADPGLELIAQVSGCDLRVEQPAPLGGWLIRKDFSNTNPDNVPSFNTIVFNGDRLTARISSASTFSRTKVGIVTISNQTGRFIVTTRPRPIDTIPDPFTFTDLTGQVRNVLVESNEVTLVGMSTFGDQGDASITNSGSSTITSGIPVTSTTVSTGSNAPNSIYSTSSGLAGALNRNPQLSWFVSGLPTGVAVSSFSIYLEDLSSPGSANPFIHWNLTGISSTVSSVGFGTNTLPSGAVRRATSFPTQVNTVGYVGPFPPTGVKNTYRLTVSAILSGSSSILTQGIEFFAGTGTSTPRRFTPKFPDQSDIVTGLNGEFQVTRGNIIIKPFSALPSKVRDGDKIKLKIRTSNESNGSVNATFRVDGIDTTNILSGQTAFRDDIWTVNSRARVCGITPFNIVTLNNAERNTRVNTSFTVNGFENDCNTRVSVSGDPNATLSIIGQTGTNNLPVSTGTTVNLSLTSGDFSQTKTVTVTVSNSGSGVVPVGTYSTTWTVNTRADNTPASVTLTANPTSVAPGGSTTLTWSSVNAARVTSATGFTATTGSGSTTVTPTVLPGNTQSYSISVEPNPAASNFPTIQTATANVTVTQDTTPDNFSLSPASYTNQDRNSQVTFTAQSSTNSQVSVSGLDSGVTVTASVTSTNNSAIILVNGTNRSTSFDVKNGDRIVVRLTNSPAQGDTVSGTLSIGSVSRSFDSTTRACTVTTSTLDLAPGVTVQGVSARINYESQTIEGVFGDASLYTGSTGGSLFSEAKAGSTGGVVRRQLSAPPPFTAISNQPTSLTITEAGVTQAFGIVVGGGGGGGWGPNPFQSGGGGGGYAAGTFPVSPGGVIGWFIGSPTPSIPPVNSRGSVSFITYQGNTVLLANGGQAGQEGGQGGDVLNFASSDKISNTGGRGTAGVAGAGGGAALGPNSSGQAQFAQPGTPLSGSGGGGGGCAIDANGTTSNRIGQKGAAGNQGVAGVEGGGGGGHSGPSLAVSGGTGAGGIGYIQYFTQPSPGTSWNDLIDAIVNEFRSFANRPPKLTEIQSFSNSFRSNTGQTLDQLRTQIRGSFNATNTASSYTDSCGGFF